MDDYKKNLEDTLYIQLTRYPRISLSNVPQSIEDLEWVIDTIESLEIKFSKIIDINSFSKIEIEVNLKSGKLLKVESGKLITYNF